MEYLFPPKHSLRISYKSKHLPGTYRRKREWVFISEDSVEMQRDNVWCTCMLVLLQAKDRMSQLEEHILQAQNREGQILDTTQWMSEMNDLLQSRLDADILAGDVPDEYEVVFMFAVLSLFIMWPS